MIHTVKDLSPDQKRAIESLLGHSITESEQISVRTLPSTPEWLKSIQHDAREKGVDQLTMDDIDDEIAAARRDRRKRLQP